MAFFDLLRKKTAREWFQEAQQIRRASEGALVDAMLRDAERLAVGQPSQDEWDRTWKSAIERGSHCLNKALHIDPTFTPALIAKAEWVDRGDSDRAMASVDKALALDPMLADAHFLKAMVLNGQRAGLAAVASLRRAVECDPHDAEAWSWLSRILRQLGDVDESRRCEAQADAIDLSVSHADALRERWLDL